MDKLRACSDCRHFQEGFALYQKRGSNQFDGGYIQACQKLGIISLRKDQPRNREYIATCQAFRRKK